ncbi:DUF2170 family protein [Pokkaliibacter sp. CJK22405]|uniref:DUF2170 family protein n=1 Tax=Pokkaliibacter sp. CJK22405 TaxID=3384615 RepID=UPI0039847E0B
MALSLSELHALLAEQEELTATLEGDTLLLTNEEGVDAFLTVQGEQVLVESLLCKVADITDTAAFNDQILRTHKTMFPLTTLGISAVGTEEFYVAFGALSASSKPESVLVEVETLFLNIEGMLEFFAAFIRA